jgi:calcium-dependent protein kinase
LLQVEPDKRISAI